MQLNSFLSFSYGKTLLAVLFLVFATFMPAAAQSNTTAKIKKLPNFSFYDLKGKKFGADQVKYDKYLTIVYFDPSCEHCIAQTEAMIKQWAKFKHTKMIWVSISDPEPIAEFKQKYFPKNNDIIFLSDKDLKVFTYFPDIIDTPTIMIYNKDKNRVAMLGETTVDKILQHYK